MASTVCLSQEINSPGDKFFYGYAYEDAISAYQKQMQQGKLITNHQRLNLADSYFKTGQFNKASRIYLDVHKQDTIISDHRYNSMLQSLSKISEEERVKAFLKSRSGKLADELIDNAEFNYDLLDSDDQRPTGFFVFTLNSNSAQADLSPAFYNDKLLFSSSRKTKSKKIYSPTGEAYLDIFSAQIQGNGGVNQANSFDGIPDSPFHKSTPYYSNESGRIYYILSNTEGKNLAFDDRGKNALAIGMAEDNGLFRFLLKDLSTSFYYPFFDEPTGKLYFAANFKDSYGGTDIYYVDTNNGQVLSQPVNLGPRVNTPGNEIAPYVFENSIYFSSDVFYGMGGMDIYRSNIQSDESFTIPVNLGKGINTKYDEFGFIIKNDEKAEGLLGYFSSNRPGGKGGDDIYGFKISEKPGLKTLVLKGMVVKSQYDLSIADASVQVSNNNGDLLKEVFTQNNGNYQLEIPYTDVITLKISKDGFSTFKETYNPKGLQELEKTPLRVQLASIDDIVKEEEEKTVIKVKDFYFDSGSSELNPTITGELDKVIDAVKQFPDIRFAIETHTDSRGGRSSNQRVSELRSDAIKSYLLNNGVSSDNITASRGFGEDRLVNDCSDGVYCLDFLHQQNLRTLFIVENVEELQ